MNIREGGSNPLFTIGSCHCFVPLKGVWVGSSGGLKGKGVMLIADGGIECKRVVRSQTINIQDKIPFLASSIVSKAVRSITSMRALMRSILGSGGGGK